MLDNYESEKRSPKYNSERSQNLDNYESNESGKKSQNPDNYESNKSGKSSHKPNNSENHNSESNRFEK